MKQYFETAESRNGETIATRWLLAPASLIILSAIFLFTSCKKSEQHSSENEMRLTANKAVNTDKEFLTYYNNLDWQTSWELQQARSATARYRNIDNAVKDGYVDIGVVVPNMGFHYMKTELVNATFDIRKPEILVYNRMEDGSIQLVAVEYAVPIDLTPNAAPEGFTGTKDVWDRNTGFGLWLLHAWVWYPNPSGVFNPTNPLIHLHEH